MRASVEMVPDWVRERRGLRPGPGLSRVPDGAGEEASAPCRTASCCGQAPLFSPAAASVFSTITFTGFRAYILVAGLRSPPGAREKVKVPIVVWPCLITESLSGRQVLPSARTSKGPGRRRTDAGRFGVDVLSQDNREGEIPGRWSRRRPAALPREGGGVPGRRDRDTAAVPPPVGPAVTPSSVMSTAALTSRAVRLLPGAGADGERTPVAPTSNARPWPAPSIDGHSSCIRSNVPLTTSWCCRWRRTSTRSSG